MQAGHLSYFKNLRASFAIICKHEIKPIRDLKRNLKSSEVNVEVIIIVSLRELDSPSPMEENVRANQDSRPSDHTRSLRGRTFRLSSSLLLCSILHRRRRLRLQILDEITKSSGFQLELRDTRLLQ